MKQSMYYIPTLKNAPADAEAKSHKLMFRAGLMKQLASGIYTYLPLGYEVLKNIQEIIRDEHEKLECAELFMPTLQPATIWQESGRWDKYGPELFRLQDRKDRDFCLGPTHEEVITDVVKEYLNSYKKLPIALYQMQTKFRDEMRPRFGLMRGREFMMKDAYTFNESQEDLNEWYERFTVAYNNIFTRCGLDTRVVESDTGQIGGSEAHEFMVLTEIGEDVITYCNTCDYAANQEHSNLNKGDQCPKCSGTIETAMGIEVGNIFKLGDKYTRSMGVKFLNKEGKEQIPVMGCYGIGISRTLMSVVEQNGDENSLVWPREITPFDVHVLIVNMKDETQKELGFEVYNNLKELGYKVLLDDRNERAGSKFKDADLIGVPYRVVVGKKASENIIEFTNRYKDLKEDVVVSDITQYIK